LSGATWGKLPKPKVGVESVPVQKVILRIVLARLHLEDRIAQRFTDGIEHDVDVERLLHQAIYERGVLIRQREVAASHHDDRGAAGRFMAVDLLQHRQPVRVGQVQIEQDEVGRSAAGQAQRFLRVPGAHGSIAFLAQQRGDQPADRCVILEHEHHFAARHGGGAPVLVPASVGVRHGGEYKGRGGCRMVAQVDLFGRTPGTDYPCAVPLVSSPPPTISLACPDCRASLSGDPLTCTGCGRVFETQDGIPLLLPSDLLGDTEQRQHALYAAVAHEYDDVFPKHVAEHYIEKRTGLVRNLLPMGGLVLDAGCGTGQLGAAIASEGYAVFGVDLSPSMVAKARERGLAGTFSAITTALPFADNSFDLALTVATLHHLETPERVAATVREMGRIVKRGGYVVLWDHNPANPYWPILMKRVPQDSGDERLVPLDELLRDTRAAGLQAYRVFRSGFTPDFLPASLAGVWRWVERAVEITPGLNILAAHNVVVARKP
jgi:SAM-dependent methyltransferase